MGVLSKAWKGVKNAFKKIGRGIKKVAKKVGKVLGKIAKPFQKLGIIGQLALGFLMPWAIGSTFSYLTGNAFSSVIAGLTGPGANIVQKAVGYTFQGVQMAANGLKTAYTSVTGAIDGAFTQLGEKVGFIGKVSDDEFGSKYEEGLKKENVEYFYSKKKEELPTGTCLILVTPDSERTMCTFLGTAGKINENDVDIDVIKKSKIIFLEGYLWDEGEPKKAFDKAINSANKVAMSLSDQFCVDRHKTHFLELVKNKLLQYKDQFYLNA